jgi:hypothetical protein
MEDLMRIQKLICGGSLLLLVSAASATADTIVVPNTVAAVEGNDSNFGPFFDNSVRYQQVYSASQFPSLTAPLKITGISFRPDGSVSDPSLTLIFDSVQIDLSTTSATPATLSTTFGDNVGADDRTVFDSFVFMHAPVTGPAGGPKDFTVSFSITPFIYDPAAGNLLMDVRAFESSGGISGFLDAESGSPFTAHVDAPSLGAASGDFFGTGLVTQFQFTAVPEPSTMVLCLLGALLVGVGIKLPRATRARNRASRH